MRHATAVLGLVLLLAWTPRSGRAAPDPGPWFVNVAAEAGLDGIPSTRTIWTDLDGDRYPDLVLHGPGARREATGRVLLSRPALGGSARRFVETTGASRIRLDGEGEERPVSFAVAGDVDDDGDTDLFTAVYLDLERPDDEGNLPDDPGHRSAVLLNDGEGRFSPAEASAPAEHPATTSAASFLDADADGNLDLFVGNWYREYGRSYEAYPNRLFLGQGDGTFVDGTEEADLLTIPRPDDPRGSQPTYGVTHLDWNGDGAQDIICCNYGRRRNRLWRNDGDGTFTDVGEETGLAFDAIREDPVRGEPPFRTGGNTFDAACADVNGDGHVDVFLAEITHWWAGPSSDLSTLLLNRGPDEDGRFERRLDLGIVRAHRDPRRWNQGDLHAGWLDVENDGDLDLVLASSDYPDDQRLRIFRQGPDGRFEDATERLGIDWRNPTAISLADYDRDGDIDIVCGNNEMRLTPEQREGRELELALWRNEVGQRNGFVGLFLEGGGGANRSAIGARVTVEAGGRTQVREVRGGLGHSGHQDELPVLFGLGDAEEVDRLEIRWPDASGTTEVYEDLPARRYYEARIGHGIEPVETP